MSAWSSVYENKVLLTKPFQASQSWHQMSVYENKILVQNCLLNEWILVFIFNCSNWEKFVKQICENIWWIRYLKGKDKAFDNVSLYAFFGIMIPLVIISTCFIMITMKVKKMRQSLRISQNFTDVSHKKLAQAKLWNQVTFSSLSRWKILTLEKIKIGWVL